MNISTSRLADIKNEIRTNKKLYLEKCKLNYNEYIHAALILYPKTYQKIELIENEKQYLFHYNLKSLEYKKEKNLDSEINLLLMAVGGDIYTPYSYERLAILYTKKKDYTAAFEICKRWFDSEYWMIPNVSSGSLRILNRLEKLKLKTGGLDGG
jgi:hypothetical protein